MPDTSTKDSAKLPVFKDKVMYISSANNKNKIEQSYVISASFKGILRLSPNNYNTINEKNPVELTPAEDDSMSSSYSDAIVFEDSALDDTKTNADIRRRFIIGSDSDGYLVNFRFSDKSFEFDNLGVIGITSADKMTIYSNDEPSDMTALILGNTIMPSLPNRLDNSRAQLNEYIGEIKNIDETYTEDFDEIEIDITGNGDNSYLLHGSRNNEGKRQFSYKRSQQFIRDLIMEALLSIQSVPTGSIHWLPVTYEQYCKLVGTEGSYKQYPNHFFKKNSTGNDSDQYADPIIRDYLLCDGRKYNSREFPELAKILMNENITYWDENGKYHTHTNTSTNKVTDEAGNTTFVQDGYFRVPDLRSKFISYVHSPSVLNALEADTSDIQSSKTDEWNITGTYTPDNSPKYPSGLSGEHFHFLAYASYNSYNTCIEATNNGFYNFKGYKESEELNQKNQQARIWYLSTTAGSHSEYDGQGGYAYGFGASGDRRRSQSSHDIIPACAFVSAPDGGRNVFKNEPTCGLTSKSKMIYQIPTQNNETYKITKYETFENDYQNLEGSITQTTTNNVLPQRYGFENAPKFYAFLPLIRI